MFEIQKYLNKIFGKDRYLHSKLHCLNYRLTFLYDVDGLKMVNQSQNPRISKRQKITMAPILYEWSKLKWLQLVYLWKGKFIRINIFLRTTAWKVFQYGIFSGPSFPAFGLNTEIYCKYLYSALIQENMDQKKLRILTLFTQSTRIQKWTYFKLLIEN